MEQHIVAHESTLPYRAIPTAAVRGRSPLALLRNGTTIAAGVIAASTLLRELRPAAILGTGGYVCVPLFLAARLHRIPTLIYLPDVVPGLAVRVLARIATQVACSVEDSRSYLAPDAGSGKTIIVTGYPVRPELHHLNRAACRAAFALSEDLPVVVVYGGSRGARSINRAVEALLPDLLTMAQVIHICGREGDETWLQAAADCLDTERRKRYRLYPYLESERGNEGAGKTLAPTMTAALGAADLALCRSGASTLGELPILGLPALLVPYPYVHQDENADYLVRHGAAVKISDAALPGNNAPGDGTLHTWLHRLLHTHTQERLQMAKRSSALARPDAAHHLADALHHLAAKRGNL